MDELSRVLEEYSNVLINKHAKTDCNPKRLKSYRVPITLHKRVDHQIKELLDSDLIEPSDSDWEHLAVCVKNGSLRLNIDSLFSSYTVPMYYIL
ncbi:transposon Ty3-I Gag-Pol polyprotein [Nephila pilipes]|uniref:Transposon Ty3-I Gag-Pol polyprotein n=1 Tax=Nephila pilipes TaxID=299642 RepID=A0A8X6UTE9_NEPPI|nr:transposon Ty3-I Gag-Pol polyprotein [Nephila pilipes]